MTVINLTPHPVTLATYQRDVLVPPDGRVPRQIVGPAWKQVD